MRLFIFILAAIAGVHTATIGGVDQTGDANKLRVDERQQWYEIDVSLRYNDERYEVRLVFTRNEEEDIHLFICEEGRNTSRVLMHTKFHAVGYFLDAESVPDPEDPSRDLLLIHTVSQYPMGHLWRIDLKGKRIQKLLEGTYLDARYLFSQQVVTEWTPAHYVLAEGWYDFQLMAKRSWRWCKRSRCFVPTWWRIAEPTYEYFHWIDKLTEQYETIGTPCEPPKPVPADLEAKGQYLERWARSVRLSKAAKRYDIQVAYSGGVGVVDESYLSIYETSGKRARLVRCTRIDDLGLGHVISLRTVPDPNDPGRSLVVVYTENGRCVIWRIDPNTMRPVVVMDEFFLDVSQIQRGIVKEWTQALSLVKEAGWNAYPPAFRDPKAMAYRVWRWDRRRQRFVVASSWRLGKWSRADYRRFGFWE